MRPRHSVAIPGRVGMVSLRMYYLDTYARDGKVYVCYIGAYLRNTQTI